jgi:hypothetical protein
MAEFPVTEEPKLPFCGRQVRSWPQLREARRGLGAGGPVLASFSCVAWQRLFSSATIVAPDRGPVTIAAALCQRLGIDRL